MFDSADQKTAEDKKLIRGAMEDIRDGNTGAFDDAQYTIYTAENGTQSEGGIPKDFIGPTDPNNVALPAPAPEPSTLLLMGSGLISIAGTVRRRFRV
jgi:PEP-CTERM motif